MQSTLCKIWYGWIPSWNQDLWEKINNLRYMEDNTLMAENEEEIKSLLMRVKEESEKVSLKLSIQNTNTMASCPITSWQIEGEKVVTDFIFLGSKLTVDSDYSHEIKRYLLLGRKTNKSRQYIKKQRETSLCQKRSAWSKLWFFQ